MSLDRRSLLKMLSIAAVPQVPATAALDAEIAKVAEATAVAIRDRVLMVVRAKEPWSRDLHERVNESLRSWLDNNNMKDVTLLTLPSWMEVDFYSLPGGESCSGSEPLKSESSESSR